MNAITDFNQAEALVMALECDKHRFEMQDLPPLYGIPVSIKNNLIIRNFDSSMGMISKFGIVDREDGLLVQILKE